MCERVAHNRLERSGEAPAAQPARLSRRAVQHEVIGMRVLFARISWMTWYRGDPNDQPVSQMAFVKQRQGPVWERFNFSPVIGRVFGYIAPSGEAPYQFARIDRGAAGSDHLDGVLVVFMAARPTEFGGGQVVVGWYKNATLYPTWREPQGGDRRFRDRRDWGYCCECATSDAVLLPTPARTWLIPHGRGGMGQAKVRYFEARHPWMRRILDEIEEYTGSSLVARPDVEAEAVAAASGELAQAGGQGFASDPRVRRLIEDRAIALAKKAYSAAGYDVKVVGQPFDLHCRRKSGGLTDLWVEVKGSQGEAQEVILTRGEVEFYSKRFPNTELFVVNSIRVDTGAARGGKPVRYRRWPARPDALRPMTYWYRLPSRNS